MRMPIITAALLAMVTAAQAGDKVEVTGAQFGIFCQSETGAVSFMPSTAVPLVVGQGYGWIINLKTDKRTVHWREEFTLPSAPTSWGTPNEGFQPSISPDRKVSVLEQDASLEKGSLIFNTWAVAPGDPIGKYKIRVIVDKAVEHTFEFDVLEPAQVPNAQCPTPKGQNAVMRAIDRPRA